MREGRDRIEGVDEETLRALRNLQKSSQERRKRIRELMLRPLDDFCKDEEQSTQDNDDE